MNYTTEISQELKAKLLDAVRNKLFVLPAFRLKGKQINVFNTYAISQLKRNTLQIQFNSKSYRSISPDSLDQFSQSTKNAELYNFRGFLKKIKVIWQMIPKITWIKLFVSIFLFLAGYFLFHRQANIWLKLVGSIFALVLPFVSLAFCFDIYSLYLLVRNTFGFLYRISKEVQSYIDNIS